jgi:uncharacterized membrane protein
MSNSKKTINYSPLVSAALTLDGHFSALIQLSERIELIDLKSNIDFDQTERLMKQFAETGEAISKSTSNFVTALNETRVQAETAAQKVSEKAVQLKIRKDERQEKMSLFHELNLKVNQLNQSLIQFKRPAGEVLSDIEREELRGRLRETANQLMNLIAEAEQLKSIGRDSKIKALEKNAEAMRKSLVTVNQKITGLITTH